MAKVFLSLGSNLGNRGENLKKALIDLEKWGVKILNTSKIYETEPLDYKDQDKFYNLCVETETTLLPEDLLKAISIIELSLGRVRDIPFGPRTIDIDILLYENLIIENQDLQIPHKRLQERKFVLIPLSEIAPEVIHPVFKKSLKKLLSECEDKSEVEILK